ncbi:hypothetical protein BSL78_24478 [Apostichopus japonicus]|uniref:Sushi domain-containing protein n=1 Tax=Stichopus japonicus TaxID=307972 RepID=A0A2G8JSE1_STIJA|nr:hypothetical protein BSL78_24478 [Apostichopus japonicus]
MEYFSILCILSLSVVTFSETCPKLNVTEPLLFGDKNSNTSYDEDEVISFSCGERRLVGEKYAVCINGEFYVSQVPDCQDKKSVKTVISLATKWIPDYDNNSSNDFKVFQADICASFDDVFEIFNYSLRCYVSSFMESNQVTIANVINDFTAESIEGPSDVENAINGAIQLGHTVPGMRYNVTEDTKANSTYLKECDENFDICDDHYGTCNDIGKGNYKCSCIHGTYQSENIKVDGTDCSVGKYTSLPQDPHSKFHYHCNKLLLDHPQRKDR